MIDAVVNKGARVVLGIVQPNDLRNVQVLKNVNIARGRVTVGLMFAGDTVHRAHKRQKLTRDDPVKVTVLDLLIVLVLLNVEVAVIIPTVLESELKTLKAMLDSTFIKAVALRSVPVGSKQAHVGSKRFHNLITVLLQDDEHEGSNEECRVRHVNTIVSGLREVVNFGLAGILLASEKLLKFAAVAMYVCEVQGSEILVEGRVTKFVIDVEEERVLDVLRGISIRNPVKLVRNNFDLLTKTVELLLDRRVLFTNLDGFLLSGRGRSGLVTV